MLAQVFAHHPPKVKSAFIALRNSGGLGREHGTGDQGSTRANDILHKFPFSLPYSGYVYRGDGKVYDQGTDGYFWSAGSDSATSARDLGYDGNYTNPEHSHYKTGGWSVRCVIVKSTNIGKYDFILNIKIARR